ncbi:MAG TPA: histidine kinase, partial [Candidatus Binataceae bacterium]|nr:histidine kinase [Candidatus Binataceae bacterium]
MAGSDLITATNEGADLTIARARLGLGLIAPLSIYVDPANNGWFDITSYSLAVLLAYLAYALSAYLVVRKKPVLVRSIRYLSITAFLDVLFAAAVALVTEGPTSPSWLFFVFAILAVNLRTRFHAGVFITLCSSGIYLALLRIAAPGRQFEMRAAYLAIVGYLIRFFGHEHSELEKAVRELETEQQRHQIARALHDGYIQALATVNLQLDTCRKLLKSQRLEDATLMVEDIQTG